MENVLKNSKRRPNRNGIDWYDTERLEKTERLRFSRILSFEEEIVAPHMEKQSHKISFPVGSVRVFSRIENRYVPNAVGSFFFIGPGVAITAFHIISDYLEQITSSDYFVEFVASLGKGRMAVYHGNHFSAARNGDVAIVGLTPALLPSDWLVEQKYFDICARIPSYREVVNCVGFRDVATANPKTLSSKLHIRNGVVTDTLPTGRDNIILPFPCFLTNLKTIGGMSGGPIFNHQGKCLGMISAGSNPKESAPYTYGACLYFNMVIDYTNSWPPNRANFKKPLIDSKHINIEDKFMITRSPHGGIGSHSIECTVSPLAPLDGLEVNIST